MRSALYVGWIPNVAGRLSFSHIGASDHPTPCETENVGDHFGRRLYVLQQRPLSDWLLPNWYFQFLYGFSSDWLFLLVAETKPDPYDQIARLEGEVLVFDRAAFNARDNSWSDSRARSIEEVCQDILPAWVSGYAPSSEAAVQDLFQQVRSRSIFSFDVGIRRNGVVWISPKYLSSKLAFADDYDAPIRLAEEDDLKYISNQAFFFLKDIGHIHRHHHKSSDTITEVGVADAQLSWAIEAHYRIHRKIIEMRRSKNPTDLYNASGMLAYLASLKKATRLRSRDADRGPLTYNNSEIEASLKSSLEVMKWKQTQKNIIKTALPALLIGLISVLGYEYGNIGHIIRQSINEFIINNPLNSIGIAMVIILTAPIYYGIWDISNSPPIIFAKRIMVSKSAKVHGMFWIISSIFIFATAICILFSTLLIKYFGLPWLTPYKSAIAWGGAAASLIIVSTVIYALPFWATRRDFVSRVSRWFGTLRSAFGSLASTFRNRHL